jgi:hypothetical protein
MRTIKRVVIAGDPRITDQTAVGTALCRALDSIGADDAVLVLADEPLFVGLITRAVAQRRPNRTLVETHSVPVDQYGPFAPSIAISDMMATDIDACVIFPITPFTDAGTTLSRYVWLTGASAAAHNIPVFIAEGHNLIDCGDDYLDYAEAWSSPKTSA